MQLICTKKQRAYLNPNDNRVYSNDEQEEKKRNDPRGHTVIGGAVLGGLYYHRYHWPLPPPPLLSANQRSPSAELPSVPRDSNIQKLFSTGRISSFLLFSS